MKYLLYILLACSFLGTPLTADKIEFSAAELFLLLSEMEPADQPKIWNFLKPIIKVQLVQPEATIKVSDIPWKDLTALQQWFQKEYHLAHKIFLTFDPSFNEPLDYGAIALFNYYVHALRDNLRNVDKNGRS